MWHLCRVAVIGFVLCCRSDQGKIDREGLRVCVCVCVAVVPTMCAHTREGVDSVYSREGEGLKGQVLR